MSKKDLPLILAWVGILYLVTRSSASPVSSGTVPGGVPSIPGVGSIVTGISSFFSNLFGGGGFNPGNPGINPVTNPGMYPSGGGTPGPADSGNPCDPSSVQYNPDICAEL